LLQRGKTYQNFSDNVSSGNFLPDNFFLDNILASRRIPDQVRDDERFTISFYLQMLITCPPIYRKKKLPQAGFINPLRTIALTLTTTLHILRNDRIDYVAPWTGVALLILITICHIYRLATLSLAKL
jgi:hypothetical protein